MNALPGDTRKGFTLIELLVVIAIIGVLSTIILASLTEARNKSYYAKAAGDAHTLQLALAQYYADNGDWPPVNQSIAVDTSGDYAAWVGFLDIIKPYLSDIRVFGFPTIKSGNSLIQGYSDGKGTKDAPIVYKTFDGKSGQFVACITIRDGYWVDFILPQQSPLTLDDGGIDPDGIEKFDGDYTITQDPNDCGG